MKKLLMTLLVLLSTVAMRAQTVAPEPTAEAALEVINRFMGKDSPLTVTVTLDLAKNAQGCDKFSYTLNGNTLDVHASSPVAACRGFYDFVKSNGAGICSWTANRFEMPETPTKTSQTTFTSPYRDHQYLNVVTYGYSMPYWDEDRWDKEIDWMALHGIDMPLMLLASEAIYRKVFTELGVSESDLNAWEVGPAHLPWMRMGNLAGNSFDGPLGQPWHDSQIRIAKYILRRMAQLGMKPVVPAFGGFVPKAYAEKLGAGNYSATGWNWVPQTYRNYRITPAVPQFKQIGKRFIELWDQEFESSYGTFKYYLSDSFNEMDVPNDLNVLRNYGDQIYQAIIEGSQNPEAVWVTQGWEFVYGSGKWTNGATTSSKYKALTQDCAPHQFMSLYMAPEYGGYKWGQYDNFDGDDWNYTMLPNMGGKNFWTGRLQSYVSDYPRNMAQGGAYKNCTGWGMTMEGIEYNELLYELISDMGWTDPLKGPTVENWMNSYGKARFGNAYDQTFKNLYTALRNTVYSSYIDHQNFGFQGNGRTSGYYENGNIGTTNDTFFQGFDNFFSEANVEKMKAAGPLSATLRADIIEFAAFYASAVVPKLCKRINTAINSGKKDDAAALIEELEKLMVNADYLLTGHPLYDEAKWEEKARKLAAGNAAVEKKYVKNARRIVSTWYGAHGSAANSHEPVNDYASRIYAGTMRDYYMPRLRTELTNRLGTTNTNLRNIEFAFIPNGDNTQAAPALSKPRHYFAEGGTVTEVAEGITAENTTDAQLLDMAKALIDQAREDGTFVVSKDPFYASDDLENHWYYIHSNNPNKLEYVLTSTGNQAAPKAGVNAQTINGGDAQMWRFVKTGTDTYRIENRNGQVFSLDGENMMTYMANVNCDVYLEKDETNDRWSLIPNAKRSAQHNSVHFNNNNQFTIWQNKENGSFIDASTWTIETTDASAVPEEADYARFARRLSGFNADRHGDATRYGQPGQPKTANDLATAIKAVDHRILALESFSGYLGTFRKTVNEHFNLDGITGNQNAENLFELILSAFQLDPSINNVESINAAFHDALVEAQQQLANVSNLTDAQLKQAKSKLETAVKTYINSCASFPFTSPAPKADGTFDATSKVITMKFGNAQFVSLDAMESGSFKINKSTTPGSNNHGYWVVCGNDSEGYTFYNLAKGTTKVLGITGLEASARAALYNAKRVPSGVTTKFLYATNNNGQHVFYFNANNKRNAWNNRDGWFATWNGDGAFAADQGSAIICTEVKGVDASKVTFEVDPAGDPITCTIQKQGTDLYFTTTWVADGGYKTYSLSTEPETFTLTPEDGAWSIQSNDTQLNVGYTGGPTSWDFTDKSDLWTIEHVDGTATSILKDANTGFGTDKTEDAAGVFTNKTGQKWIINVIKPTTAVETPRAHVYNNNVFYDIKGRMADMLRRGEIYIKNGKKVIK